jgi:hypothetical protein
MDASRQANPCQYQHAKADRRGKHQPPKDEPDITLQVKSSDQEGHDDRDDD